MKARFIGKILGLAALAMGLQVSANTASAKPEYALYNSTSGGGTIAVLRSKGEVDLWLCDDTYVPGDKPAENEAAVFATKHCRDVVSGTKDGVVTSVSANYITGDTTAVFSIAQMYSNPRNAAKGGEMVSVMSTYAISTWAGNPVGAADSIVYTGVEITHDHGETPRISSVRLTYELVAVTRAQ